MGSKGIVASTVAMGVLLQEGIGDTIRVSLTPEPGGDRSKEVIVAQEMLQTMGMRSFTPLVIACPGCGRTTSTFFQELADDIQAYVRNQMPIWREQYQGVEEMNLAVMITQVQPAVIITDGNGGNFKINVQGFDGTIQDNFTTQEILLLGIPFNTNPTTISRCRQD